tara:strand:- start:13566 stop:14162 length:597 start_codon:yes stop_codon:yes gene_type:complete
MGLFYHNGKPLFVDGKLAFSKACCCNLACNRRVILLYIGAGSDQIVEPTNPPLRTGRGGRSYLMYQADSIDTVSTPPGSGYKNKVWTVEFCYDEADKLPDDEKHPSESYEDELKEWACQAALDWTGDDTCYYTYEDLDNPYAQATYDAIEASNMINMDSLVGPGNWEMQRNHGPILKSNCPECSCDFSCIPDGTEDPE